VEPCIVKNSSLLELYLILAISPPLRHKSNICFSKNNYIRRLFQRVLIIKKILSENKKKFMHIYNQISRELYMLINGKKIINNN